MNNNSPLVSICIISYNSAKTIVDTLNSAKIQSYSNIEVVVSDDCSVDNTVELCQKWANEHTDISMQIVTTEKNTGVSGNLNRALKAAKGDWLKIMAADDVLFDYSIQCYVDYVISNSKEVVVSKLHFFGNNTENIKIKKKYYNAYYNKYSKLSPKEQYKLMLQECLMPMPGFFISNRLLQEIGYIDERYPFGEEWPTYITIMKLGYEIPYIDVELIGYRCEDVSLGSDANNRLNIRVFKDTVKYFYECRRQLMIENGFYLKAWGQTLDFKTETIRYYSTNRTFIEQLKIIIFMLLNPFNYSRVVRKLFNYSK